MNIFTVNRPDKLMLTDTAGPEEQFGVKSRVELLACSSHCYGGQSAGSGVGDVADVLGYEFKIFAAH
jgi:hypothetical protein